MRPTLPTALSLGLLGLYCASSIGCDPGVKEENNQLRADLDQAQQQLVLRDRRIETLDGQVTAAREAMERKDGELALAKVGVDLDGELRAVFHTTQGRINCLLTPEKSPLTVANFVGLAEGTKAWTHPETGADMTGQSLYNGTIFHRVIPQFMVQGGDPLGRGVGGPGYSIPDEFDPSLRHDRGGVLSMANRGPDTGGSQFFITEVPTPHLDDRHSIFGFCDEVELVQQMTAVPRDSGDRPSREQRLRRVEIIRGGS